MLRRLLIAALIAGASAGLVASALQMAKIWPLILQAETYEAKEPAAPAAAHAHPPGTPVHEHGEAWAPEDGAQRMGFTVLFNLLAGIGFALLLNGGLALRRAVDAHAKIDPHTGILWGLAGFTCFALAPALGLPPELPGMDAADLTLRQAWWIGTALATAAGIALLAFAPGRLLKVLGAVLILAPHLIGAPQPAEHASAVPAALAVEFAIASLATAAVFWVVLGGVSGWLQRRLASA